LLQFVVLVLIERGGMEMPRRMRCLRAQLMNGVECQRLDYEPRWRVVTGSDELLHQMQLIGFKLT
jgi:hypothetical protein